MSSLVELSNSHESQRTFSLGEFTRSNQCLDSYPCSIPAYDLEMCSRFIFLCSKKYSSPIAAHCRGVGKISQCLLQILYECRLEDLPLISDQEYNYLIKYFSFDIHALNFIKSLGAETIVKVLLPSLHFISVFIPSKVTE